MLRVSSSGIALIKAHEGLRLEAYLAPEGKWTIGYGHLIKDDEQRLLRGSISEKRAVDILRDDLGRAERSVRALVEVSLTQPQFDALVSFTFNLGGGALSRSTLLRKLNEGDYAGARSEFPRWCKARVNGKLTVLPGLQRRRREEAEMFEVAEERRNQAETE